MGKIRLEKVYRNALQIELEMRGIEAKREVDINVYYKGHAVGTHAADLFVETC